MSPAIVTKVLRDEPSGRITAGGPGVSCGARLAGDVGGTNAADGATRSGNACHNAAGRVLGAVDDAELATPACATSTSEAIAPAARRASGALGRRLLLPALTVPCTTAAAATTA